MPELKEGMDSMSERPVVNIADLSKADVLAALFNAAMAPRYMGALQFQHGPYVMTKEWAAELTELGNTATPDYGGMSIPGRAALYFDYLYGRCLKLDLTDDNAFDPWGFDRDNGGDGSAQKVIDRLRRTGEVCEAPIGDARSWLRRVVNESLQRYDDGDHGGALAQFFIGTARHPGTKHIPEWELTGPMLAMGFQGGRSEAEKAMAGFAV